MRSVDWDLEFSFAGHYCVANFGYQGEADFRTGPGWSFRGCAEPPGDGQRFSALQRPPHTHTSFLPSHPGRALWSLMRESLPSSIAPMNMIGWSPLKQTLFQKQNLPVQKRGLTGDTLHLFSCRCYNKGATSMIILSSAQLRRHHGPQQAPRPVVPWLSIHITWETWHASAWNPFLDFLLTGMG